MTLVTCSDTPKAGFFGNTQMTQCRFSCNDPKFSGTQALANSADPDQTAPIGVVGSGSTLFVIPLALYAQFFLSKDLFKKNNSKILASDNLGTLR